MWKETLFLRAFTFFKIPLICFVRPSVVTMTPERVEIKIPLNWFTRNHLRSMYFGTLAIGADCAAGFLVAHKIFSRKLPVSFAFKDVRGEFLKRAEGDVLFVCEQGVALNQALDAALTTGERQNITVQIQAMVPERLGTEPAAIFHLTLSLKKKGADQNSMPNRKVRA